jgi:hypothetical protein
MNTRYLAIWALTTVLFGCAGPWEVLSSPETSRTPMAFEQLSVSFERGLLPVSPEETISVDLQTALAVIEDEMANAISASLDTITVTRSQSDTHDASRNAIITWENLEVGQTGLHAKPTRLTARIQWRSQGYVTDELRITEHLRPSIFTLDATDRLRQCAQRMGAHLSRWIQQTHLP